MFEPYTDIDGDTHQIFKQSKGSSCGPACVATVAKKGGKSVGDDWIGSLIDKRVPTISGMAGQSHDWNKAGTFKVQDALRKVGFSGAYTDKTGNFERAFRRCTKTKPGMAWMRYWQYSDVQGWFTDWNTGFMHWVVILGPARTDSSQFIVLDPSVGGSSQPFADLPYYKTPAQGVSPDGVFSVWQDEGVTTTV